MKLPNQLITYLRSSVAMTGLCIFDPLIAHRMRPDLWQARAECVADFSSRYGQSFSGDYAHFGTQNCQAEIEGIGRVKVFACSQDNLAQRILWLTGMVVTSVDLGAPEVPASASQVPVTPHAISGDLFEGVATKEPGRACGSCDGFSSRSSCIRHTQSGIEFPAANVLRRCPAYQPVFEERDGRSGSLLWLEIFTKMA